MLPSPDIFLPSFSHSSIHTYIHSSLSFPRHSSAGYHHRCYFHTISIHYITSDCYGTFFFQIFYPFWLFLLVFSLYLNELKRGKESQFNFIKNNTQHYIGYTFRVDSWFSGPYFWVNYLRS